MIKIPPGLREIIAEKRAEVKEIYSSGAAASYKKLAFHLSPPTGSFYNALSKPGFHLIAEFKRASPSKGDIRPGAQPEEIAQLYERCGASAISVLTDQPFFKGSLDDLSRVSRATSIPILRKEFVIDPAQIYEGKVHGADAILLIKSILEYSQLKDYLALAKELGMDCLVESHTESELEEAIGSGACILGINNRDLNTFKTDIKTTFDLMPMVPEDRILVAESGIYPHNVQRFRDTGKVKVILSGDAIMSIKKNPTPSDMEDTVRALLGNKSP